MSIIRFIAAIILLSHTQLCVARELDADEKLLFYESNLDPDYASRSNREIDQVFSVLKDHYSRLQPLSERVDLIMKKSRNDRTEAEKEAVQELIHNLEDVASWLKLEIEKITLESHEKIESYIKFLGRMHAANIFCQIDDSNYMPNHIKDIKNKNIYTNSAIDNYFYEGNNWMLNRVNENFNCEIQKMRNTEMARLSSNMSKLNDIESPAK